MKNKLVPLLMSPDTILTCKSYILKLYDPITGGTLSGRLDKSSDWYHVSRIDHFTEEDTPSVKH